MQEEGLASVLHLLLDYLWVADVERVQCALEAAHQRVDLTRDGLARLYAMSGLKRVRSEEFLIERIHLMKRCCSCTRRTTAKCFIVNAKHRRFKYVCHPCQQQSTYFGTIRRQDALSTPGMYGAPSEYQLKCFLKSYHVVARRRGCHLYWRQLLERDARTHFSTKAQVAV